MEQKQLPGTDPAGGGQKQAELPQAGRQRPQITAVLDKIEQATESGYEDCWTCRNYDLNELLCSARGKKLRYSRDPKPFCFPIKARAKKEDIT